MKIVGSKIKAARQAKGMSQEELAQAIGTTKSAISRYESGHREPSFNTFADIANALDIPPALLLGLDRVDKYMWAGKDSERTEKLGQKIAENIRRHHGAQARANTAMEQMNEEGRNKVADYAEDILPRYKAGEGHQEAPQSPPAPTEGQSTTPPPDAPETPPEGE